MKKVFVYLKNLFDAMRGMWPPTQQQSTPQPPEGGAKVQTPLLAPPSGGWGVDRGAGLLDALEAFLEGEYEFRFNKVSEVTEYRRRTDGVKAPFRQVGQRELNGLCIEARKNGIECWDRDVSRYIHSVLIPSYHPLADYMAGLPAWDGTDRLDALARRVSGEPVWVNGFRIWMRGLAMQWMGAEPLHGNSVAPVLVSRRQGMHKSTFCRMLLPDELQAYYTDSFDMASIAAAEKKLGAFGLITLDELDKYSPRKMAWLKSLMQMAGLNLKKAYRNHFSPLSRTASFIATSNRMDLLADTTGSRRFLCVEVMRKIDASPIDHLQVYAQLKAELAAGARHWFTTEEETELMAHNEAFQKKAPEENLFHQCFRLAADQEEAPMLSATHILKELKRRYPAALSATCLPTFTKTLTLLGADRIHTRYGNRYRVVPLDKAV